MPLSLTPEKGLLFRITHVDNLPWLLANGLSCASANVLDPNFVEIGNPDLISKRKQRAVLLAPHGTLADYVPFYFTPKSPMLLNIKTGYKGITRRPNAEIAILVSSVQYMQESDVKLLFTDRHAYVRSADWSDDPVNLASMIDWDILQRHDFKQTDDYPEKMDRYQAEALAYRHVPVAALIGIGCASAPDQSSIENMVRRAGLNLRVVSRPQWYF